MVGEKMFQEKGEYYCINGCLSYPMDMTRIKDFIQLFVPFLFGLAIKRNLIF